MASYFSTGTVHVASLVWVKRSVLTGFRGRRLGDWRGFSAKIDPKQSARFSKPIGSRRLPQKRTTFKFKRKRSISCGPDFDDLDAGNLKDYAEALRNDEIVDRSGSEIR